jgi:hypothetical protein
MNLRTIALAIFGASACRHEFRYSDLKRTGIPVPPMPADFEGAMEWHRKAHSHPSHSERVSWKCSKCGKEFRAHCGLDVLHHGTPIG